MVKHLENMEFAVSKEASKPQSKADSSYAKLLLRPVLEFFYSEFLRDCCRDCGIEVGGTKADSIGRLCKVDSDTEHFLRQLSVDQLEAIAEEIEHSN